MFWWCTAAELDTGRVLKCYRAFCSSDHFAPVTTRCYFDGIKKRKSDWIREIVLLQLISSVMRSLLSRSVVVGEQSPVNISEGKWRSTECSQYQLNVTNIFKPFLTCQNALKLTYSNLLFQIFSGGGPPELRFPGRGEGKWKQRLVRGKERGWRRERAG